MGRSQPIVAIDGPAGSGKSTVARALATQLGFVHVDTGALYRAVGYLALEHSCNLNDEAAIEALLRHAHLEFRSLPEGNRLFLNGVDISAGIRRENVGKAASQVSAYSGVRAALLGLQRTLGGKGGSVLEGRDIGTVIFPDAEVKIFLNADLTERAARRTRELVAKGLVADLESVRKEMEERDRNDSLRALAPLKRADDAVEIDSTKLSIPEVLAKITAIVREKQAVMGG